MAAVCFHLSLSDCQTISWTLTTAIKLLLIHDKLLTIYVLWTNMKYFISKDSFCDAQKMKKLKKTIILQAVKNPEKNLVEFQTGVFPTTSVV